MKEAAKVRTKLSETWRPNEAEIWESRHGHDIEKITKSTKNLQVVGGDFNAELGPGIGIFRLSVGPRSLKKSNSRGGWLKQWLM